ncbi:TetR/AcrR family transcriptional regulator [Paenibacillus sp. FSL R10-2771]|uniref:TetR/AcrR family transcriptional regulator n=1 Tax=Paenibacillus sp. FSL R10-2771 TaxID=2954693 RepID=UPI0030F4DC2C
MRIKNLQITEPNIIKAAWELLDQIGIEDFSMRKLADLLHIQAPSLYWHFKSKQSLFQTLANEVAKEALQSAKLEGEWEEQLFQCASMIRSVMIKYPCSAQLLMRTVPSEPDYLALINSLLQIVDHHPVSDSDKFSSIACLLNYVIAFELDKYEQRRVDTAMKKEAEGGAQGMFMDSLAHLSGEGPNVVQRMHHNGLFRELGSDNMFRTGLKIIIAGISQLAQQQA